MKMLAKKIIGGWLLATLLAGAQLASASGLDAAQQSKVDAKVKEIQSWAAMPAIVDAVKAYNTSKSPSAAAMDQAKWSGLSVIDPYVRSMTKNAAAEALKAKKGEVVSEAFLSGADGGKVAFLGKPTNWTHKGKAKHDQPMSGKTWQGAVEIDESSGLQQVQVAVPVVDGGKPIGSLVVGLSIGKLGK
jgi:hypothetical protein